MTFPWYRNEIPYLSAEQMTLVDRIVTEAFGIKLIQMIENAGRALAVVARQRYLGNNPQGKRAVVMAGAGGNGGGALVCARRLHGWGVHVSVILGKPGHAFTPVPAHQLALIRRLGVPVRMPPDSARQHSEGDVKPDLVVDGLIGYSLAGPPRNGIADSIRWANAHGAPILALDIPSGVAASTGKVYDPAIRASATLTLALPKEGLRGYDAEGYVGEVYLADIGIPPEVYEEPGLDLTVGPMFAESDIVRLA